jgi:hypothetical protein
MLKHEAHISTTNMVGVLLMRRVRLRSRHHCGSREIKATAALEARVAARRQGVRWAWLMSDVDGMEGESLWRGAGIYSRRLAEVGFEGTVVPLDLDIQGHYPDDYIGM